MIIETSTGIAVDLASPEPHMFRIEDIVRSLGMQTRYNGHTKFFYSVAQHCVNVAHCMLRDGESNKVALDGLLHDAHEAYIGDIVSPVKRIEGVGQALERVSKSIDECIYEALALEIPNVETCAKVKEMDYVMLVTEARDMMPSKGEWWGVPYHPRQDMFIDRGWMPDEAIQKFEDLYMRLRESL